MSRTVFLLLVLVATLPAMAQGVLGDVFSGKLINPEPGVWSWYEVSDTTGGAKYFLRQAVVGTEAVKSKDGFWVETELVPQEGFPTLFKMLLTGPASDPKNVHQMIVKEGTSAPQSVPVPQDGYTATNSGERQLLGMEKVKIGSGEEIETQHFSVGDGVGKAEIWVNDSVRPLGIVKMVSAEGQLLLQRFGTGGKDAESVISAYSEDIGKDQEAGKVKVEVRVNGEKKDVPAAAPKAAPAAEDKKPASAKTPKKSKKAKEN